MVCATRHRHRLVPDEQTHSLNGSRAVDESSIVAQLPPGVPAPCPYSTVIECREAMIGDRSGPDRDRFPTNGQIDLNRNPAEDKHAIAHLTETSVAPRPNRAVIRQCQAMIKPGRNRDGLSGQRQWLDLNGYQTVGRTVIPQLTIQIVAPCPKSAIIRDRQTMSGARRDADDCPGPPSRVDLNRGCFLEGAVIAKSAVAIIAPGPHGAISCPRQTVPVSGRDRGNRS